MALSNREANEIYTWLSAGWPTVLKPGASADFVATKVRELMRDFAKYSKEEVMDGIAHWRTKNEKFPVTKSIINEIEWIRAQAKAKQKDGSTDDDGWPMEIVYPDGNEACYGVFTRAQFINHPKNPERLQPEEWKRRFMIRRQQIYERKVKEGEWQ